MGMEIRVPRDAEAILRRLNAAGYSAYVVGGCVRDSLLGLTPKDWDICTSARPEEIKEALAGWHLVDTGLKHGTVTAVLNHVPYEVTAYRLDGVYTDHRHPDSVTYVTDLLSDLKRRDFTVNAMAFHPEEGIIDAFGGRADLEKRLIRCVGDPGARFGEDALRILRALRFAAVYGFDIEARTAAAARRMVGDLDRVAGERIRAEMAKLLCGSAAEGILRAYPDVMTAVFPELAPMVGFDQHSPWHRYDVWEHTVRAVGNVAPEETLRWAMLFHDSGKPGAYRADETGRGHFYGHQKGSALIAEAAFARLHMDTATRDRALLLIEHHDTDLAPEPKRIRRQMNRWGADVLRQLIEVRRADRLAAGVVPPEEVEAQAAAMSAALDAVLASDPCVTLKQLAVTGADLLSIGMAPGKALGETLQALLEAVMSEEVPNEQDALLDLARSMKRETVPNSGTE